MKDASVYEAALEVKEAIYNGLGQLGEDMGKLDSRLKGLPRREALAVAIAPEVVKQLMCGGLGKPAPDKLAYLAERVWLLADAIDKGDPQKRPPDTMGDAGNGESFIDLEKPPDDE